MSNLYNFLTDLATNPAQQMAFTQNPQAVMQQAGLTEIDQAILKSNNQAEVTAVYADELDEPSFCMVDPNPDPMPDPDPPATPKPSKKEKKDKKDN